jgi:hypothetical protein
MNDITALPTSDQILALQNVLAAGPQWTVETNHFFADGMYCRTVFRRAGTIIVGRVHKKEHFYIIASGEVTIIGDGYRERIVGPKVLVSKPGTKRAVIAHVDTTCITIHRTPFTNLDQVEEDISVIDPESPIGTGNKVKPGVLELLP